MNVEYCTGTVVTVPFNHHKIDALLYHPVTHSDHLESRPVILRLHGILGNLLDDTEHCLPHAFSKKGYSSVTMNTLLANLGLFYGFGVFEDTMAQIDALCRYLMDLGFKKIILAGHGLGGCMALRYGALANGLKQDSSVVGVIAIATPYSMPETIRRRWKRFGSEPSYDEMRRRAEHVFKPKSGNEPGLDETVVVRKAHGVTYQPEHTEIYTLKTWWALAGPEAEGTKTFHQVGHIKVPILLVHGIKDDISAHREVEDLCRIARDGENDDITHFHLDANHTFEGNHKELADIIIHWLQDRFE